MSEPHPTGGQPNTGEPKVEKQINEEGLKNLIRSSILEALGTRKTGDLGGVEMLTRKLIARTHPDSIDSRIAVLSKDGKFKALVDEMTRSGELQYDSKKDRYSVPTKKAEAAPKTKEPLDFNSEKGKAALSEIEATLKTFIGTTISVSGVSQRLGTDLATSRRLLEHFKKDLEPDPSDSTGNIFLVIKNLPPTPEDVQKIQEETDKNAAEKERREQSELEKDMADTRKNIKEAEKQYEFYQFPEPISDRVQKVIDRLIWAKVLIPFKSEGEGIYLIGSVLEKAVEEQREKIRKAGKPRDFIYTKPRAEIDQIKADRYVEEGLWEQDKDNPLAYRTIVPKTPELNQSELDKNLIEETLRELTKQIEKSADQNNIYVTFKDNLDPRYITALIKRGTIQASEKEGRYLIVQQLKERVEEERKKIREKTDSPWFKFDNPSEFIELVAKTLIADGMLEPDPTDPTKYQRVKKQEGIFEWVDSATTPTPEPAEASVDQPEKGEVDSYLQEAIALVLKEKKPSASFLQRKFPIGYNRAARIIEEMERLGIVGPVKGGATPRDILVTEWPPASTTPESAPTNEKTPDASPFPDKDEPLDAEELPDDPLAPEPRDVGAFLADMPELDVLSVEATPDDAASAESGEDSEVTRGVKEKLQNIFDAFKEKASLFHRKYIKGEVTETEPAKLDTIEISKTVGTTLIGVALSLGGIKAFADVPAWLLQKFKYTKAERRRIQESIDQASTADRQKVKLPTESVDNTYQWEIIDETRDGKIRIGRTLEDGTREARMVSESDIERENFLSPVELKKRRLEKAVNDSKYLSPEKKQELLNKLQNTVETYEMEGDEYALEYKNQIAKILDKAIQTRVKGITALKETLNTVMIATGVATLRSAAYGAVALYERGVKVREEMKEGKRTESFATELITNGFKETWQKLNLKTGETKKQKIMNYVQAMGTIMRFAGFGLMAGREIILDEGSIMTSIDRALDAAEKKGVLQAGLDNFVDNFAKWEDRLTSGFGLFADEPAPAEGLPTTETAMAHVDGSPALTGSALGELPSEDVSDGSTEPVAPIADESPSRTDPSTELVEGAHVEGIRAEDVAAADTEINTAEPVEVTGEVLLDPAELEAGKIIKGDGVIRALQRQLAVNPGKYGFEGNIDDKKALSKWVHKTAFSITKQDGLVNKNGWLGVSGKAIGKMTIGLETGADGKHHIQFYDAQTGVKSSLEDMREKGFVRDYQKPKIVESLRSEPTEPSTPSAEPEPKPLADETPSGKAAVEAPIEADTDTDEIPPTQGLPVPTGDEQVVDAGEVPETSTPETEPASPEEPFEDEPTLDSGGFNEPPIHQFDSSQGAFHFEHTDGRATSFTLDASPTNADLQKAAARFGTNEDAIQQAYNKPGTPQYRGEQRANALLGKMERETRIEATLQEMKNQGYAETDEYRLLQKEAGKLKGIIKRTFTILGFNQDQLRGVEQATAGVAEEAVSNQELADVEPDAPEAPKTPPTDAPTSEAPPETPAPTLETTKSPGGLEFTSDYSAEEQANIADYVQQGRLENEATRKLLMEYQNKYGDRPQFAEFSKQVEQRIASNESRLDKIIKRVSGQIPGRVEIQPINSAMNSEEGARTIAENHLAQVDRKLGLTNQNERSDNLFDELEEPEETPDNSSPEEAVTESDKTEVEPDVVEESTVPSDQIPEPEKTPVEEVSEAEQPNQDVFKSKYGELTFVREGDEIVKMRYESGPLSYEDRLEAEKLVGITKEDIDKLARQTARPGRANIQVTDFRSSFDSLLKHSMVLKEMETQGQNNSEQYTFLKKQADRILRKFQR